MGDFNLLLLATLRRLSAKFARYLAFDSRQERYASFQIDVDTKRGAYFVRDVFRDLGESPQPKKKHYISDRF